MQSLQRRTVEATRPSSSLVFSSRPPCAVRSRYAAESSAKKRLRSRWSSFSRLSVLRRRLLRNSWRSIRSGCSDTPLDKGRSIRLLPDGRRVANPRRMGAWDWVLVGLLVGSVAIMFWYEAASDPQLRLALAYVDLGLVAFFVAEWAWRVSRAPAKGRY